METFHRVTLAQSGHRKAFSKGDNFFMIKKNEKIRIRTELISYIDVSQLAICIVHDSVNFRDKIIQVCQGSPAFEINYPDRFVSETIQLEGYRGVLGFTTSVEPETKEINLYVTFKQLSTSVINHGNIHDARQWNLLFLTNSNNKNSWKELACLPIQICAEITGKTRNPKARKRAKRLELGKHATWRCNLQLRMHDMEKEIDSKQKTIDQQQKVINHLKNIVNVDTMIFLQDLKVFEPNSKFRVDEKIAQWQETWRIMENHGRNQLDT